jgi:hypothetical protein
MPESRKQLFGGARALAARKKSGQPRLMGEMVGMALIRVKAR